MIELKKLRKVYKSLRSDDCVALKDIDLQLPDTGLVFIIGKSGSGKSTLLNLLGGLDTITSGDIIADGNSIASFKGEDFENYRSSYIGFVFQHYYLLEELTVEQNIEMAMSIVGRSDRKRVRELLERVGLSGCGKRYPRELSGGQQQRVAIARALAKDPKLILGDELTGNLDHKTSVDILTVLKEISKEKLVIVVSHNLDEADMFADRIIELHDGQVFRDRVRVKNAQKKFYIKGKVAYLPYFRDLTENEVRALDAGLKKGEITDIVQLDDGFAKNGQIINSDRQIPLKNNKFVKKAKREYTGIFTKKGMLTKIITVAIVTLMLLCVSVFSSLHKIQQSEVDYTKDERYLALVKGDLEAPGAGLFSSSYHRLLDHEIKKAEEISGTEVLELVNVTVTPDAYAASNTASGYQADIRRNLNGFYIKETYGTLICNEQFLIDEYGRDGKLTVLAGDMYDESFPGVIVTDYVADSYLKLQPEKYKSYQDVLDAQMKIIAVIDTDYEEKYADIILRYENYEGDDDYQALYLDLCEEEHFRDFLEELVYTLGVTYTFNENFKTDYSNNPTIKKFTVRNISFERDGVLYPEDSKINLTVAPNKNLVGSANGESGYTEVNDGEIKIHYSLYNQIFGTSYTLQNYDTFVPHDVVMKIYDQKNEDGTVIYEKAYRIVGIYTSNMQVSDTDFEDFREFHLQTFGIYVENNENLDSVVSAMTEHRMMPKTIASDAIIGINKMLGVFIPLFKLIAGGLYAFIVIYLINHAMQTIKKNYFQIGVLRSFGAKSIDVGSIFITGVVLTGMLIAILSILFEPLVINVYNEILVESFTMVLNTYAFDIQVINMSPWMPVMNAVLVIAVTMASALLSLLVLRKLKPIEIIRAKDNGGEVS